MVPKLRNAIGAKGLALLEAFNLLKPLVEQMVIVCSGYMVDLERFEKENGLRPDAAIQKPYDIKDLTLKIRNLIDEAHAPLFS